MPVPAPSLVPTPSPTTPAPTITFVPTATVIPTSTPTPAPTETCTQLCTSSQSDVYDVVEEIVDDVMDNVDETQEAVEIQVEVIYYQHFSAAAKELAANENLKAMEKSPSQDTLDHYNALARQILPDVKVLQTAQATEKEEGQKKEEGEEPVLLREEEEELAASSSEKKTSWIKVSGVKTSYADLAVVSMGAMVLGAIGSRFVSVSSTRRRASSYETL